MVSSTVIHSLHCYRCGWEWIPRQAKPPVKCPACKSPYWDKPKVRKGKPKLVNDGTESDASTDDRGDSGDLAQTGADPQ
jgi:DNA-directed RNA polymerase subunit RPC12/RpoP